MIRLGGIFSGRNAADTVSVPEVQGAISDAGGTGTDSLAARLRDMVAQGGAVPSPVMAASGTMTRDADRAPPVPEPVPDESVTALPPDLDLSQIALPADVGAARRSGRVRTRLLGFESTQDIDRDPIEATRAAAPETAGLHFPVGWIVVIRGPGRGTALALGNGVSQIGRGPDQTVRLDYGDTSISRSNHAAIAYDDEVNGFFIGHGGKANLVRLNDRPVVSTEPLNDRDVIRIGETALLFVSLCRDDFRWQDEGAHGGG